MLTRRAVLTAVCCLGFWTAAHAALDVTRRAAILRAGPDDAFPAVVRLANATGVSVHGCLAGGDWCDVQWGRTRGWLRKADIAPSSRVGAAPATTFSVAEYWDAHYRRRPWYADRERWAGWGTPGFVPPPAR
jgi:uncharacterized protein YraI